MPVAAVMPGIGGKGGTGGGPGTGRSAKEVATGGGTADPVDFGQAAFAAAFRAVTPARICSYQALFLAAAGPERTGGTTEPAASTSTNELTGSAKVTTSGAAVRRLTRRVDCVPAAGPAGIARGTTDRWGGRWAASPRPSP
jgi:hypothetical protein